MGLPRRARAAAARAGRMCLARRRNRGGRPSLLLGLRLGLPLRAALHRTRYVCASCPALHGPLLPLTGFAFPHRDRTRSPPIAPAARCAPRYACQTTWARRSHTPARTAGRSQRAMSGARLVPVSPGALTVASLRVCACAASSASSQPKSILTTLYPTARTWWGRLLSPGRAVTGLTGSLEHSSLLRDARMRVHWVQRRPTRRPRRRTHRCGAGGRQTDACRRT